MIFFLRYVIFFLLAVPVQADFSTQIKSLINDVSENIKTPKTLWRFLTCRSDPKLPHTKSVLDKKKKPTTEDIDLITRSMALLHEKNEGIDLDLIQNLQRESKDKSEAYQKQIGYYYLILKEVERARGSVIDDRLLKRDVSKKSLLSLERIAAFQKMIKERIRKKPEILEKTTLSKDDEQKVNRFIDTYMGTDDVRFGGEKHLEDFADFEEKITSDLPLSHKPISNVEAVVDKKFSVFFNNDGYIYDQADDESAEKSKVDFFASGQQMKPGVRYYFTNITKGDPLKNGARNPVGYSISLPADDDLDIEKPIKGLVISIYGGGNTMRNGRGYAMFRAGSTSLEDRYLNKQGYATAHLNLPDLLELDRALDQHDISEALFKRNMACVNTFIDTIRKNPEKLHHALAPLKNIPIYVSGTSFGGGMAVRFVEEFPNAVDAVISINGGLVAAHQDHTWLNASLPENIKKLKKPALIIQNYDDNRVLAARNAYRFVEEARHAGKKDLVRMYIPREGEYKADSLYGHALSSKKEIFDKNMRAIMRFLEDPAHKKLDTDRKKWVGRGIYAKKQYRERGREHFYDDLNVYDYFVNEAVLAYDRLSKIEQNSIKRSMRGLNNLWEKEFQPILDRAYIVAMFPSYSMREYFFLSVFDDLYPGGSETSKRQAFAQKAIEAFLPDFLAFLIRKHPDKRELKNIDVKLYAKSKEFQNWMLKNREFFLPEFLAANPDLVKDIISSNKLLVLGEARIANPDFGKFKLYLQDVERIQIFSDHYPAFQESIERAKRLLRDEILLYEGLA